MTMKTLIWFRDDLRTEDHPALRKAIKHGIEGMAAVFIATPESWNEHRMGAPRVSFILATLKSLQTDLEAIGIPLVFRTASSHSDAPRIIEELVRQHGIKEVHAGLEYGVDEIARDRAVSKILNPLNATLLLSDTQTILPVYEIRNKAGLPYKVFTPFRRAWEEKYLASLQPDDTPLSQATPLDLETTKLPQRIDGFQDWKTHELWPAGQAAAHSRLTGFIEEDGASGYKDKRDRPDMEGTSSLSPWLAVGAISPTRCLAAITSIHGPDITSWPEGPRCWQSELVWREFYRYVMASFPQVSRNQPMQRWTTDIPWREAPEDLAAWKEGRTGIDIVDAGMMQLKHTGWMHNRVRMVVAMFLCKNLLIDWREGEAHFSRSLIDYDFASNNGGWQWAASTGTDAAPYFRIFNAETQGVRFDPDGTYRRRWLGDRTLGSLPPIVDLKTSRVRAIETFKVAQAEWQESKQA